MIKITAFTEDPVSITHTRIGNILFQVATCLALAWKHNIYPTFPNINDKFSNEYDEYKRTLFRNLNYDLITHDNHIYEELFQYRGIYQFDKIPINIQKDTVIKGYFQSHKYFDEFRDKLLQIFSIDDVTFNYIKTKYPILIDNNIIKICIHARRGDYINHGISLSIDYYKKALQILNNNLNNNNPYKIDNNAIKYLIFTDDINWAKGEPLFNSDNFIVIDDEKDYVHLWMMTLCDHYILANSTFSWWGCYLSHNNNYKAIYPNSWFNVMRKSGRETKEEFNNKNKLRQHDFLLNKWIGISF